MKIKMTAADLTKWIAWGGCTVHQIEGRNNQAASVFIQFHEQCSTIATGRAPEGAGLECLANDGFIFTFPGGLEFKELTIGLSTSEINFQSVGANGGLDMTVEVGGAYLCNGNEVVVGDFTTAVASRQLWSEANGVNPPKRLLRVDITDLGNYQTNNTAYGLLTAQDGMQVGAASFISQPMKVTSGSGTQTFHFGPHFSPFQQDVTNYANHAGGSVFLSNSANVLANPASATTGGIRGIYRNITTDIGPM